MSHPYPHDLPPPPTRFRSGSLSPQISPPPEVPFPSSYQRSQSSSRAPYPSRYCPCTSDRDVSFEDRLYHVNHSMWGTSRLIGLRLSDFLSYGRFVHEPDLVAAIERAVQGQQRERAVLMNDPRATPGYHGRGQGQAGTEGEEELTPGCMSAWFGWKRVRVGKETGEEGARVEERLRMNLERLGFVERGRDG